MGYIPTTGLKKILKLKKRIRAIQGGCLGKGTNVLLHDLTYKKVEDIVVGDKLIGPDGKERNVLGLYRGKSKLFKVEQKKGIDYVVNDKHILVLEEKSKEIRKNRKRESDGKWIRAYSGCKRSEGLNKIIAKDFYNGSRRSTIRRYKGIKTGLNFKNRKVLLDPYYLGLWLGDGCSRNASITNIDKEILDYLFNEIPKIYDVFVGKHDKVTTKIVKKRGKYNDVVQRLKKYNLILNKHIPICYIRNSRNIRLKLLAGLIDSDGCLTRDNKTKTTRGYYITQKNKKLAEGILLLCRTLGYYCTLRERVATMKRDDGSVYSCPVNSVSIFPKNYNEIPVKVSRKKCSVINYKNPLASSIELKDLGEGDYYGFELDGDHLFLLEDLTITHNTSSAKTISLLLILIDMAQRDKTPTLASVVSESFPHLKRGAIRDFLNIMQAQNYFKAERWNKTDFIYTFETGSQIEFFSSDQPGKVRGPRRHRLFINESNNIPFETFEQLEVRTSDIIFLDWNPVSEYWFEIEVLPKRDDVDHIITTYKDNEGLSKDIVRSIESRKNRYGWWRVYGEGLLGEAEEKIYRGWNTALEEIPHEAKMIRRWLDFGYSADETAIGTIYYYNGGYILDEVLYQKGLSNKNIADTLLNSEEPQTLVIADSAEPKSIDEIKSYGVNILPCEKGPDSVRNGIQIVQDQRISVTKKSLNIIKEYRNYVWKKDKEGKITKEPIDIWDHHMAGIRYALSSLKGELSPIEQIRREREVEQTRREARDPSDYGL